MSNQPTKILMVDDEPNVLSAYRRTLGRLFTVVCAEGGENGLIAIEKEGPFAVIVTDMRMPGMSGIEFIHASREKCKDSVYLMLTGNADQQTAVDAINTGHIFRFLSKPCSQELLETSLRAALRQHEMVIAERVLLRDTLTGSIRLMVDALELADPYVGGVQSMIKQSVRDLCAYFKIPYDWQFVVAGSVCLVGLVGVPRIRKDTRPDEAELMSAATLSSRLVVNIPRMATISAVLARQREPGMMPLDMTDHSKDNLETIAARFVKISSDMAFEVRLGHTRQSAMRVLQASGAYDPRLAEAMTVIAQSADDSDPNQIIIREINVSDIRSGMVLDADLTKPDGTLLLSKGQPISELAAANLRGQAHMGVLKGSIKVQIRAAA